MRAHVLAAKVEKVADKHFEKRRCSMAKYRLARLVVCGTAAVLTVIHPLIHGTPLDGGLLDGVLTQLDMLAMGLSNG